MKNLILLLILSVTSIGFAQEQSECDKNRGLMALYAKNKMYRDALNFFAKAYEVCGGEEGLEFVDWNNARIITKKLLKIEKNETAQAGLSDTLIWIFEKGDTYGDNPKWKVEYATYLVKTNSDSVALIDDLYGKSIHVLKEEGKTYDMQYYYRHIIRKFNDAKGEDKEVVRDFALDEYLLLSDYIGIQIKAEDDPKRKEGLQKVQNNLDIYFSKLATDCDQITSVLGKKVTALPKDKAAKIAAAKKYLNLLEKRNCTDSDLYGQFADTLLTLEPTAEAYYSQGNFFVIKNDYDKARDYFKKAIEMEGEGENAGKYTYGLAVAYYSSGSYKAAFNTAKGVQGEYRGKAMKVCGDAIAKTANSCGDTSFERKANFWLANDYYRKAAAAGAEVSTSQYLSAAPSNEEVFDQGLSQGGSFTLKCWGESTTIR
ncbi:MAG: tetratricopeptide repeat protein [Putridiphycobacter sp.]